VLTFGFQGGLNAQNELYVFVNTMSATAVHVIARQPKQLPPDTPQRVGVQSAAGIDASGQPLAPTTLGSTWEDVARDASHLVTQQRSAMRPTSNVGPLTLSADEAALLAPLTQEPEPGSSTHFVVVGQKPGDVMYGTGGTGNGVEARAADSKNPNVFESFSDAAQAAASRSGGGAWVYRVDLDNAPQGRSRAPSEQIMGAVYVDGKTGQPLPLAIPNVNSPSWDTLNAPHAAFDGASWPDVWSRLREGAIAQGTPVYVYLVKSGSPLHAGPGDRTSIGIDEIVGWGRMPAKSGKPLRWYGRAEPGKGLPLPRPDMVKMLGSGGTRPRAALPQSADTYFVVSATAPGKVIAAKKLDDVALGTDGFTLSSQQTQAGGRRGEPFGSMVAVGTSMLGAGVEIHHAIVTKQVSGRLATLLTGTRPISKVRSSLSETMSLYLRTQINQAIDEAANGNGAAAKGRIESLFNKGGLLGLSPNVATEGGTLLVRLGDIAEARSTLDGLPQGADPAAAKANLDKAIAAAKQIKFKTNFATTAVGGFMRRASLGLGTISATSSFLNMTDWTGLVKGLVGLYGTGAQANYIRSMYRYKSALDDPDTPHPTWKIIRLAGNINNFGYVLNGLTDTAIGVNYLVRGDAANGYLSFMQAAGEFGLYAGSYNAKAMRGTPLYILLMAGGATGLLVNALASQPPDTHDRSKHHSP